MILLKSIPWLTLLPIIASKELKQLVFLWRHGDRTPHWSFYPNYERDYNNTYKNMWPKGPGTVTVRGAKEHIELGRYLRKRYADFIPEEFNNKDIYIRSTSRDRIIESALANTIGMFPNPNTTDRVVHPIDGDFSILDKHIPIPVHMLDKPNDFDLDLPNKADICPVYDSFIDHIQQSEGFKKINEEHKELFQLLDQHSGLDVNISIFNLNLVADPIQVSYIHGYGLPSWLPKERYEEMVDLWGYSAYAVSSDLEKNIHTQAMRVNGGLLVKTIQEDMKRFFGKKLNDDSDKKKRSHKVRVYSGRSKSVTNLMIALDVYNMKWVPYAACLMFEVYDDESIKLLWRNETSQEPMELRLCRNNVLGDDGSPCFLDTWFKETSHLIVDNEQQLFEECGLTHPKKQHEQIIALEKEVEDLNAKWLASDDLVSELLLESAENRITNDLRKQLASVQKQVQIWKDKYEVERNRRLSRLDLRRESLTTRANMT